MRRNIRKERGKEREGRKEGERKREREREREREGEGRRLYRLGQEAATSIYFITLSYQLDARKVGF